MLVEAPQGCQSGNSRFLQDQMAQQRLHFPMVTALRHMPKLAQFLVGLVMTGKAFVL